MLSLIRSIHTYSLCMANTIQGFEVLSSLTNTYRDYHSKEKTSQVALQLFDCLLQAGYWKNPLPQHQIYMNLLASTIHFLRKLTLKDWTWMEMTGELIFRTASFLSLFERTLTQRSTYVPLTSSQIRILQSSAFLIGGGLILVSRIPQILFTYFFFINLMLAKVSKYSLPRFLLRLAYYHGYGISRNDGEAVKWFTEAAEQGLAAAQNNLEWIYAEGRGVSQNNAKAAKWFTKAAEQGHDAAQYNLGCMYAVGRGVPRNDAEAVKWYTKAAEQGDDSAQFNLGCMYKEGRGVPRNDATAVKWLRKAAEQGHPVAQNNLGWMYSAGRGASRNDAAAANWYTKAAKQGDAEAQKRLENLYRQGRANPPA